MNYLSTLVWLQEIYFPYPNRLIYSVQIDLQNSEWLKFFKKNSTEIMFSCLCIK